MSEQPRPAIRATDADREHTVGRLSDASVNGSLTLEELADRAELAHRARTRDELATLVRDLPTGHGQSLYVANRREWAVCSHLTRGGRWLPAEHNRYVSLCGTIDIDLREAVLHGPVIDLEVISWFGTTTVLVPEGAVVELDAGGFGHPRATGRRRTRTGGSDRAAAHARGLWHHPRAHPAAPAGCAESGRAELPRSLVTGPRSARRPGSPAQAARAGGWPLP